MLARKKLLGEYKIGRTIGEGAFSKVKLATHKVTGQKVAIKVMRKDELENEKKEEKEKEKKEAQRNPYLAEQMRLAAEKSTAQNRDILQKLSKEVKLLMRLDHPNVIRLHQVIETDTEMYIIMEFASGGELIDYIAAKGHLSEREGRKLFRQLISAIDHCHLAGVVHRDLKLENLLLSSDKNLRLSDFGLGRTVRTTDQYLNTFCGTPLYAGPELVSGIKYIGPSADIWSMGIVLYIMMAGKPPFKCDTIAELYQQIKGVKYTCPEHFSPELKALLAKILVRNPATRATIEDLRTDPWVCKDDKEPAPRYEPKVKVADRQAGAIIDDEIDELIGSVEQCEGFTAYNFHKPEDVLGMSKDASNEEILHGGGSDILHEQPQQPQVASAQVGRPRRASLAVAFTKLNPFSSDQSKTLTASKKEEVANSGTGATTANRVRSASGQHAVPQSAPTSPTRPDAPKELLAPLPSTHRRRHSVAVGAPSPTPSHSESSSSTAASSLLDPISRPTPAKVTTSIASSRQSSTMSPSSSTMSHSPSGTFSRPPMIISSDGSSVDEESKKDGPSPISKQTNKANGPSMEQINENEDEMTPKNSAIAMPVTRSRTNPPKSAGLAVPATAARRASVNENFGLVSGPGAYSDEIRAVRFGFGVHAGTQNIKDPEEIIQQLEVIFQNQALWSKQEYGDNRINNFRRGKWVYICSYEPPGLAKVTFEVEVCKVWLLKMYGIKMKRLGGDAISYKNTYEKIAEALKI